jgi:hypothetical protein
MAIDEAWAMLATRIPKALHKKLRVHCVKAEITMMSFVVACVSRITVRRTKPPVRRAIVDRIGYFAGLE